MSRFDVTTVGEPLLRLSAPIGRSLELSARLDLHVGGAEANVVATLAQFGRRCHYASSLPRHALGRLVTNQLRLRGVDLSGVVWRDEGRVGAYYAELAGPPRAIEVIYDRAGSCITTLRPTEVDWERLLDTRLLHLTGITPALSADCHAIVSEAASRAHATGVPVSIDVNYRAKLWSAEAAAAVLTPLLQNATLLYCATRDAQTLFGAPGSATDVASAGAAARHLATITGAHRVIVSAGASGVVGWDGGELSHQPAFDATVVDAIGAGDALAAGVIHGWLDDDFRRGLRLGAALAAIALGQAGDMVTVPRAPLDELTQSDGRGVRR